jgi:glutathione peroxidase
MVFFASRIDRVASSRWKCGVSKLSALVVAGCVAAGSVFASPLQDIPFKTADGKDTSLKAYAGKVVLVVNVASKCGNTPQYAGLEAMQKRLGDQGFTVIGFPCNDFGGQEPGTIQEIQTFCQANYKVTFPIMEKIHVKGTEQAPLYAALSGPGAKFPGDTKWNFGKFLIGRDGEVIARFEPKQKPEDPAVTAAVEAALK